MEIDDHLFRREAGRIVATLTRIFGVINLALAEDVVQDAFCRALEVWKFRGVPDNPASWLMATAKNRALDVLRRQRTARHFAPELALRMNVTKDEMIARLASLNFLKAPAQTTDTAKAAVFLASDRARMMTGTVLNATAGSAAD
jgi:predicted RNA polymerase sigma factor